MPSVSTMLYPAPGYVRVETNWADVGQATAVKVERVDCETGVRVPLRPYVSYSGDYLTLSCGYAIFWDTEPQLDRCVYYCATAIDASGTVVTTAADYLYSDTFARVVAGGWGSLDSGQTWVPATPADYSVNGTQGGVLFSAANISRRASINGGSETNLGFRGQVLPTVVATGAQIDLGYLLRSNVSTNNAFEFLVRFEVGGTVRVRINSIVGGGATNLADTVIPYTYTSASNFTIVGEVWGTTVRARAYDTTTPDPQEWQVSVVSTAVTAAGSPGQAARVQAGNTNVPFTPRWDNFYVYDPCADLSTVEQCSDDLIVPSNGDFRLGDPVRPCHDVTLQLSGGIDPDCVPTQGIFFASVSEDEGYPAQSAVLLPTNSRYPIVVNRQRQATVSALNVVSRTFDDRDSLRVLNDPGSPLFLRGPAQYGVNDRYMAIGDMTEHRPVSDHKVQPRGVSMPHVEVARPSGPTQGICGARVNDLCDIYSTWAAIEAAGLTWADLLRGKASNSTPIPDSVERTWNDVNATYASWTAVNSGNTDWDDLLDGA